MQITIVHCVNRARTSDIDTYNHPNSTPWFVVLLSLSGVACSSSPGHEIVHPSIRYVLQLLLLDFNFISRDSSAKYIEPNR